MNKEVTLEQFNYWVTEAQKARSEVKKLRAALKLAGIQRCEFARIAGMQELEAQCKNDIQRILEGRGDGE